MNSIAAGFWGAYFGTATLMLAGSVFASTRGLRRIGANAALSALVSILFVAAFLGLLPLDNAVADRFLAHVAMATSALLGYMLLYMLGLLRRRATARRAARLMLALVLGVLGAGWFMPADQALALSAGVACAIGFAGLAVALRSALRGERLTWAAVAGVGCMLVALTGLSWMAVTGGDAPWQLHAVSAVGGTGYLAIIAAVLWGRYSYLIELRQVMAFGPAYDPVTRMRSHAETGQMVGQAFYNVAPGEKLSVGVIAISISNLYALEKLHGRAAVNHALFVCAARLRRSVTGAVEMGRLGDDGFLVLLRNMSSPERLIQLSRALVSRLARPVALSTSRDHAALENDLTHWEADVGLGVLAASHPNIRAASAVAMARAMSRTAWSYPSRVAWYDQVAGQIAELPSNEPA